MSIKEDLCSVGDGESDAFIDLMDSQQSINEGKVQLTELLGVADSLEALIKHVESVPNMSVEHAAGIQVTCENLLRGTGYDYSVLMPALESFNGGTVSTESLKDKLQSLWKRIVSIILSVIDGLKRYWTKVSSYEGRLRMTAEALKKRGAMARGASVRKETVELGVEAKSLVVGSRIVTDPDSIIRATSALMDQYKLVTTVYPKAMVSAGQTFEGLYKRADDNVRQTLEEFCGATVNLPFNTLATSLRALTYRDPRFGPKQILAAPPVLGGWSLFISPPPIPINGLVGNDLTGHAARIRTSGIRFAQTEVNNNIAPGATVRAASGAQVELLAVKVLAILDMMRSQENSRQSNRIAGQIKAVLSAAEGYKGQTHVGGDGTLVYSESILRFARSYAGWATGPVDQMTTNLLTVSRAILIYSKRCL